MFEGGFHDKRGLQPFRDCKLPGGDRDTRRCRDAGPGETRLCKHLVVGEEARLCVGACEPGTVCFEDKADIGAEKSPSLERIGMVDYQVARPRDLIGADLDPVGVDNNRLMAERLQSPCNVFRTTTG
ncbi:MAG: hypothetical protein A4E64_01065 [Syntrophorhabdus sp. PtaU1.Bin058]|nr:MAG: hypothetical protein A4E64_01065 [Syntrophorhabdus sp. PtaU1.Bin058]